MSRHPDGTFSLLEFFHWRSRCISSVSVTLCALRKPLSFSKRSSFLSQTDLAWQMEHFLKSSGFISCIHLLTSVLKKVNLGVWLGELSFTLSNGPITFISSIIYMSIYIYAWIYAHTHTYMYICTFFLSWPLLLHLYSGGISWFLTDFANHFRILLDEIWRFIHMSWLTDWLFDWSLSIVSWVPPASVTALFK